MRIQRRNVSVLAAMVASIVGLSGAAWYVFRIPPALELAIPLAEDGRFDEAQAIVRATLRVDPDHAAANLLFAQILLKRPTANDVEGALARAREALVHLDRIPDPPARMRVLFPLWRGKALFRIGRLDDAEGAWNEALRLDPLIPDAGWGLLEIAYLEGRTEDARRLALRLHEVEPDPHDRVQLLLELVRQDAQPPAPGSLVQWFEPVVERNPAELAPALALGLALVRNGELDRGLDLLRRAAEGHPESSIVWETLLTGLDDAGQIDELAQALLRLPPAPASQNRFARFRGRVAQERQDWQTAAREYRRSLSDDPNDPKLGYRLARALRQLGATAEAEPLDRRYLAYQAAASELRPLYEEANAIKTLGVEPHPALYRRLADLRERMGLHDEARAWYRLALLEEPDDSISRAGLERLAHPDVLEAKPADRIDRLDPRAPADSGKRGGR
jgi:tetratricopeptide (TPR) repeat protein